MIFWLKTSLFARRGRGIILSMGGEVNRRQFGAGFLGFGAAAALPQNTEAQNAPTRFLESPLSPAELEQHKSRSAEKLRASIPKGIAALQYLFQHAQYLEKESQMYLPDSTERDNVVLRSRDEKGVSQLDLLVSKLSVGEAGFYIFADVDDRGRNFQRLYVMRKEASGVHFEKAYRVALAEEGFGNGKDSNQTPLGLKPILSGEIGAYGEVVRAERHLPDPKKRAVLDKYFNKIAEGAAARWFAKTFGEPATESPEQSKERDKSEVVTARYTIDEARGIHIHGTNRSGSWVGRLKQWVTLLGGRHRSTGCIRMSNTDIYDLGLSGYAQLPAGKKPGTMVMIHATKEAKAGAPDKEPEAGSDKPPRRLLPGQPGYEEQLRREEQLRQNR